MDEIVPLAEIAVAESLPPSFLAKAFQKLARHGMVVAQRGPGHGYALARAAADISVRDVLEAIEGDDLFRRCLFLSTQCSDERPCPLHHHLNHAVGELKTAIERLSLADLADPRVTTRLSPGRRGTGARQ
jgi:Rrf2 family protein